MSTPRSRIDTATSFEDLEVSASVAIGRCDEADAAVLVLVVVPVHERGDPALCVLEWVIASPDAFAEATSLERELLV